MRTATQWVTSSMGAIMGLAGVEHGIGEILQGSVRPDGIMIQSWPESAFFEVLAGEPAVTVIPNLLVAGILTLLVSLAFLAWVIAFMDRKTSGFVLILLSIMLLLVGGGIFPPVLGIIVAIFDMRIKAMFRKKPSVRLSGLRIFLGKAWLWIFLGCMATWLALFPGVALLDYFLGMDDQNLVLFVMLTAFISLPLSFLCGYMHERLVLLEPLAVDYQ
jgi:hypothetical protein